MNCTPLRHEAETCRGTPLGEKLQAEFAQRVSDRQAAVAYLHAAELTDDAVAREMLRRRSVQLLLRHPGAPRLPRAC
jgi:hypothetical protein